MKKMTCEIIKDLIPMYVDKTASEDAANAVSEHIKTCPECRRFCKVCKSYEEKVAAASEKSSSAKPSGIDEQFASLSKKLKKRKLIHIITISCVLAGMLTYIVIDILNTAKRRDNSEV